ncbi:TetR/AcrR family transcriptional regulator [Actinomyces sp. ZJ308]|uniref:TetR/AcrR family transcriptional regulator n=1 Tax=Actinomyces sp. ZJ308 TaxID=2708342 RepID=UPI0014204EF8|nr:TetR/AcrR family transcriptional regulator [Actinomyces sp. ZJ308]
MGRRRTFVESEAIGSATAVFAERGFAGASVDDLVRATGVNRASLYGVFGSKDGLFQRCLAEALAALSPQAPRADTAEAVNVSAASTAASSSTATAGHEQLDLILVALMEIAPRDPAVREDLEGALSRVGITAETLGQRLLERAGAATSSPAASTTSATSATSTSPAPTPPSA